MLDGKFPHSVVPVLFTLNGQTHELLIYTRYPSGTQQLQRFVDEPELLGKIVQATVGCWARSWTAITQDEWVVKGHAASDQFEIIDKPDNPFCTVQNKDYNGMTLTVHSYDNGQFAVNTVAASLYAIDSIEEIIPGKIKIKNAQPKSKPQGQQTQSNQPNDDEPFVPPENQSPQESNANTSMLKVINDLGDGNVLLPMAKDNEVRQARFADKNIDYNSNKPQYKDGELIVYRAYLIEPSTVGQNHLHTIKVSTEFGNMNVFKNDHTGENESYGFKTIKKSLERLGIDADGVFRLNNPLAYVIKIGHGTDKNGNEVEYKNPYGLWRLPENES